MQKNILIFLFFFSGLCEILPLKGMEENNMPLPPELMKYTMDYHSSLQTIGRLRSTCQSLRNFSVDRPEIFALCFRRCAQDGTRRFTRELELKTKKKYDNFCQSLIKAGFDQLVIENSFRDTLEDNVNEINICTFFNDCIHSENRLELIRLFLGAKKRSKDSSGKTVSLFWFQDLLKQDVDADDIKFYRELLIGFFCGVNEPDQEGFLPIQFIATMNNHKFSVELAKACCRYLAMDLNSGIGLLEAASRINVGMIEFLLSKKDNSSDDISNQALISMAEMLLLQHAQMSEEQIIDIYRSMQLLKNAGADEFIRDIDRNSAATFFQEYYDLICSSQSPEISSLADLQIVDQEEDQSLLCIDQGTFLSVAKDLSENFQQLSNRERINRLLKIKEAEQRGVNRFLKNENGQSIALFLQEYYDSVSSEKEQKALENTIENHLIRAARRGDLVTLEMILDQPFSFSKDTCAEAVIAAAKTVIEDYWSLTEPAIDDLYTIIALLKNRGVSLDFVDENGDGVESIIQKCNDKMDEIAMNESAFKQSAEESFNEDEESYDFKRFENNIFEDTVDNDLIRAAGEGELITFKAISGQHNFSPDAYACALIAAAKTIISHCYNLSAYVRYDLLSIIVLCENKGANLLFIDEDGDTAQEIMQRCRDKMNEFADNQSADESSSAEGSW